MELPRIEINVVLCTRCKGTGGYIVRELENAHKSEWCDRYKKCSACDGDGRFLQRVIYEPFPTK